MSQIAVRLSEAELRRLDAVVQEGGFRTRAEAVRAGLKMLSEARREQRIAAAYTSAYQETPITADEEQMLEAASDLAAELPR